MDKVSENNDARLSGASHAAKPDDLIGFKSPALDSERTAALEIVDKADRESTYIKSPRISQSPRILRQSIQPLMTSPHRNPENNYYRQPGCHVSRRVSVLEATRSYCRSDPESSNSRHRRFFEKMRTKIQIPSLPVVSRDVPQKIASRGTFAFLPSSALLFAGGRRDYSVKQY
ncbi:uncharacterized protein BDV17DRAFT_208076 [Aspergillus undulatus]|uniref:uncharacterized protein n=1 Tax=Aspergillus undulatus TaxID=1810928 RepID=UPI003CCCC71C